MADAMEPLILYEDARIIVIDKPAGLLVHPARSGEPGTLVDFLLARWPEIKRVGEDAGKSKGLSGPEQSEGRAERADDRAIAKEDSLRPGIVHRLDADTSGVIVVAKTNETFDYLKRSFQERKIEKKYLALVHGAMRERAGEIDYPIGHGAHTATKRTVKRDGTEVRGEREAFTAWRLMKQYPDFALVEVMPKTGRTHQIRVHMAAIGHPIAGDPLYGSRKLVPPPGLTRLFLHASHLAFSLPGGQRLVFESDLPVALQSVVDGLEMS